MSDDGRLFFIPDYCSGNSRRGGAIGGKIDLIQAGAFIDINLVFTAHPAQQDAPFLPTVTVAEEALLFIAFVNFRLLYPLSFFHCYEDIWWLHPNLLYVSPTQPAGVTQGKSEASWEGLLRFCGPLRGRWILWMWPTRTSFCSDNNLNQSGDCEMVRNIRKGLLRVASCLICRLCVVNDF